jgi:hypothetical protein
MKYIMDASKMKIVYSISERNGKSYWNRIGVAFLNSDGSLNVKLEAFPVSGELHIRDYVPRGKVQLTPEQLNHLKELGWEWDDEQDAWGFYTGHG